MKVRVYSVYVYIAGPYVVPYPGVMIKQRRENMETELERLWMVPSLHVFATTGGTGREATLFYKHLTDQISEKNTMYSKTIGVPFPSPSYDQQWCAFEAATQHPTEHPMPASNWVLQRASFLANLIIITKWTT